MTSPTWRGCAVPPELQYDVEHHVWLRFEGDEAVLGMTDVAQSMGGKLVNITWKQLNKQINRGRSLAVIESAKWVGPFPTPLTCEMVSVNPLFDEDILIANRDPYGEGWLARIKPLKLEEERQHLLDGDTAFERYRDFIEKEGIQCFRCED